MYGYIAFVMGNKCIGYTDVVILKVVCTVYSSMYLEDEVRGREDEGF